MRINIEQMKKDVNLLEVASCYGYSLNKAKTSTNSAHLKSDSGAILVKVDGDGHWVYKSVHDSSDKGSVIDFIIYRNPGFSFVEAINYIKDRYVGRKLDTPEEIKGSVLHAVETDVVGVRNSISRMDISNGNRYLVSRGISDDVVKSKRFSGAILNDRYKNAVFPHVDKNGICGAELRNFRFKGFTKGGVKSVWTSNTFNEDTFLFLVEGAIDGLSHFVLRRNGDGRYLSCGGAPSPDAWEYMLGEIEKCSSIGMKIVCAFDNDQGGDELYDNLGSRSNIAIHREKPKKKDWNVDLTKKLT